MRSAAETMEKKKAYREELYRVLPAEEADKVWKRAVSRLNSFYEKYDDLSEGVRSHTDSSIFPAAALYISAKEVMSDEQAYKLIEDISVNICAKAVVPLSKIMKIPFMPSLFIKMWDPMTKKSFGSQCGFENNFYPKEKGAYRMDILACPYKKYLTELGCPELTKIFCDNDERIYGNLPGLSFERKGTLGKGADRCDFYIHKV
ncbi:L-2-amino-thiazoline-4-carboxylic acid hydrolase [Ruminococcus sp.]|uniref:L-2-amino-thiazoline-4-carboxylic acid hydrolase n=1 Tax=Ruminococcus sp. TaxID=41978 RepID=UPI0025F126CF|nr:L-2-amino-thiazoline-4-carboxylic acid hydrolase [Ruminococcus sp.]MBQ8966115.1 L-2-amino-thiazoline-4-carboxylic acid hydrolase [Ruminococcus sp.]